MQNQPKTIQFDKPEQIELCRQLVETSNEADRLKSEMQEKLRRELMILESKAEGIKTQLAASVDMPKSELDKYSMDLMYLEQHGLAFAYERGESILPPGLQQLLGIGHDDNGVIDDDAPTAH